MPVKLLRVLQDHRFRRLGGTEEQQTDVRVIAVTNHEPPKIVADKRFREDPAAVLPELGERLNLKVRGGEEFYRHYIALALERAGGVQVKAAEMLGMSFRSFRYYAKKFNLR